MLVLDTDHLSHFDEATAAADLFVRLHEQGVRVGSMDLKVACITIVNGSRLLTRNSKDFSKVPGLGFENWLD